MKGRWGIRVNMFNIKGNIVFHKMWFLLSVTVGCVSCFEDSLCGSQGLNPPTPYRHFQLCLGQHRSNLTQTVLWKGAIFSCTWPRSCLSRPHFSVHAQNIPMQMRCNEDRTCSRYISVIASAQPRSCMSWPQLLVYA